MNIITTIKKMDTKKKIKLFSFLIILVIVLWQVGGLFSSSTPVKSAQSTTPNTFVTPSTSITQKQFVPTPVVAPDVLSGAQKSYVEGLNQLQMLQLQQKIIQTKETIASSKLAAMKTQQEIASIAHPEPIIPATPVVNYAKNLVNPTNTSLEVNNGQNYKLLYVANENSGEWQAIIGNNGTLYNATLNTVLPDGSKVIDINNTTVTLSKNGNTRQISLTPVV